MRVISGRAKGRRLKRVPGETTRPIMDRVKESLFNILGQSVPDSRWLDLFAGTGQVGIEALSRGAANVVFVDNARAAIRTIRENLKHTQLERGATVRQMDAFAYLQRPPERPFDLIYVAPPQYQGIWREVLTTLDGLTNAFLAVDGQIVVQIDPKELEPVPLKQLELIDRRRYGNTLLCFYSRISL